MDSTYNHTEHEPLRVAEWKERYNAYVEKLLNNPHNAKNPFTIILPPPNANASLHVGHAMYVYEDIMIRYALLCGRDAVWVAGADHAGFETQFVYEKHLAKQGKSRFDFLREELYNNILAFVEENKDLIQNQLSQLGFLLPWNHKQFTLDPAIRTIVYQTFKKLYDARLLYRSEKLVNYCWKDGTSFSDLEVVDKPEKGSIYTLSYQLADGSGDIQVATTRPETLFGDVAIMVHPQDVRYKHLVGKNVVLPITGREIPIIADDYVDMSFGTGAVKVTPAHDHNDFLVGKRHGLWHPAIIGFNGKIQNTATRFDGMRPKAARPEVLADLAQEGTLIETKEHDMVIKTCYKCGTVLEPLPLEQWFVHVEPMAQKAAAAIRNGEITFTPERAREQALTWLENFRDWNISRQVVWGMRIPAFQKNGEWIIEPQEERHADLIAQGYVQDPDTFDTWFSSSQWPFATLLALSHADQSALEHKDNPFHAFYPTSVMETGYDILPWWVCRMMFMGLFVTGKVPFHHVFLHGLVRDGKGQKMSKSKGNVVNPLTITEKYGTDALRAALVFQVTEGNDVSLAEEKVKGMRNFGNKLWNMARFLQMATTFPTGEDTQDYASERQKLMIEWDAVQQEYQKHMDKREFGMALETLHEFAWHRVADVYIESLKNSLKQGDTDTVTLLSDVFDWILVALHPFMPFVTETLWKERKGQEESILPL